MPERGTNEDIQSANVARMIASGVVREKSLKKGSRLRAGDDVLQRRFWTRAADGKGRLAGTAKRAQIRDEVRCEAVVGADIDLRDSLRHDVGDVHRSSVATRESYRWEGRTVVAVKHDSICCDVLSILV